LTQHGASDGNWKTMTHNQTLCQLKCELRRFWRKGKENYNYGAQDCHEIAKIGFGLTALQVVDIQSDRLDVFRL
jgi:hypothetical protein